MKWNDDKTITVEPPKKPKKVTGTRFAAILGQNVWNTPFNAWCAITRTYEEPFEDTIYTIAGKAIEPKQAEYMAGKYFWKKLIKPADVWGEDYFQKTYGDFYPDQPVFGGMWDFLFVDKHGNPETVLEMKTTKRSEDWKDDIPEYYALQAALYAWLLHVDDVIMVCTILEDKDYEHPEGFVVNATNTFEKAFKVSERYPDFEHILLAVEDWWKLHVLTGISPVYDEKRDAEILKALKTSNLSPDADLDAILKEAAELQEILNKAKATLAGTEKRLEVLKGMIKDHAISEMEGTDLKGIVCSGYGYDWVTAKTVSMKIDEEALKADGLLDKYKTKESVSYRLTPKMKGEK